MNFFFFLKRQRISLEHFITHNKINSYEELISVITSMGIKAPTREDIDYEFKKHVEERAAVKSSGKKKRVSNSKSEKSKTDDSTSARGSRSSQRVRKSPTKRQRKRNSDKVEPVQPASGSESSK